MKIKRADIVSELNHNILIGSNVFDDSASLACVCVYTLFYMSKWNVSIYTVVTHTQVK